MSHTLPLAEARQRLSELVNEVEQYHDHVTVTKNGKPAAVIVSSEEWEEIEETSFWRSQPGIHEDIAEARREIERGEVYSLDDIRADLEQRGDYGDAW